MFLPRLALVLLLLALSACDTGGPARATSDLDLLTPEPIDWRALSQNPASLIGTWDWVSSLSGEAPIPGTTPQEVGTAVLTPESSGRTETWIFRADGTATRLENGEVVFESGYRVRPRAYWNWTEDDFASIQFGDDGYGLDFGTDGDALILDSTPVDGPQSRYRRR